MATLPQFTTQTSAPKPVLLQIEDQYNKRIDDDISKLVDCFTDIIKVGEVTCHHVTYNIAYTHCTDFRIKTRINSKWLKKDIK